jgi:molecular chaperone GrpE (heat shock protein)
VRAIREQLLDVLRHEGVAPIDVAPGAPFDPETQEAMESQDGPVPEVMVRDVLRPGYRHMGRLLRPARVAVIRPRARNED